MIRLAPKHELRGTDLASSMEAWSKWHAHHMAAHSAAVVLADAVTLHRAADEMSMRLSLGVTP